MPTLVKSANNEQLEAAEKKRADSIPEKKPNVFLDNLAGDVREKWTKAKDAKRRPYRKMMDGKRQRLGIYSQRKLSAMKAMFGAEYEPIFTMITETKCRALEAWVKEVVITPEGDPFDLAPTPVPDLPPLVEQMARERVLDDMINRLLQEALNMGMQPDPMMVAQQFEQMGPAIKEMVDNEIKKQARQAAEQMKEVISDQLREGSWHEAFEESIYDLATYGTAIIKGPVLRKRLLRYRKFNPNTGTFIPVIEEEIRPVFERVNPMDMYPGPDNSDIEDGYICHKITFSRKEVSDLLDVEGFDNDAIRRVLTRHKSGELTDWTDMDSERKHLESKHNVLAYSEGIDCIEYWGTASGKHLKMWGLKDKTIDDDAKEYPVAVWLIGDEVIKAMINPSPVGQIPFSKCNFVTDPDSFWGRGGIPSLVMHAQNLANSAARNIMLNVAIAAGPQVEINIDRLAPGVSPDVWPFKVWKTNNQGMQEGRAVNFYAPPMVTSQLMEVYAFCSDLADEDSGVPKYAHGSPEATGAGKTATGLSMLMTSSSRGIKAVIKNIDNGLIKPTIEKMYNYNMDFEESDIELIGDVDVVPKGSTSLIAKEQQAVRRNEFLINTNNPVDNQILGLKGRKHMLRETAKSLEIDLDELFDEEAEIMQRAMGGAAQPVQQPGVAPPPAPATLDGAGNPVQGKDTQLEERGE